MAAIWKRCKTQKRQPKCIAHGDTQFAVDALKRVVLKVDGYEIVLTESDLMKILEQKLKSLGMPQKKKKS